MDVITLSAIIGEDRRLVIELPPNTPTGLVDLVIRLHENVPSAPTDNPAREAIRAKLLAAGRLVTDIYASEDAVPLSPEELLRIGRLPPGSPSLDELIDEDRGEI